MTPEIPGEMDDALRRQQDHDAIAQGIAEMEAGQGVTIEEARRLTDAKLAVSAACGITLDPGHPSS